MYKLRSSKTAVPLKAFGEGICLNPTLSRLYIILSAYCAVASGFTEKEKAEDAQPQLDPKIHTTAGTHKDPAGPLVQRKKLNSPGPELPPRIWL